MVVSDAKFKKQMKESDMRGRSLIMILPGTTYTGPIWHRILLDSYDLGLRTLVSNLTIVSNCTACIAAAYH
jgi:hypothetical protein